MVGVHHMRTPSKTAAIALTSQPELKPKLAENHTRKVVDVCEDGTQARPVYKLRDLRRSSSRIREPASSLLAADVGFGH
jgi:hypothetical protein